MGCLYALLDLPAHVGTIRRNLRGRDFTGSFVTFLIFLALLFPTAWAFWAFDQAPTWDWTAPIRGQLLAQNIGDAEIAGNLVSAGFIVSALIWLFNASPTLIELSFPSAARGVPALALVLKVAILFDYVTDWPAMWRAVTAFAWPNWNLLTTLLQFITCAIFTLIVSMVLQVLIGAILVVLWCCVENMASGGRQAARAVVVDTE